MKFWKSIWYCWWFTQKHRQKRRTSIRILIRTFSATWWIQIKTSYFVIFETLTLTFRVNAQSVKVIQIKRISLILPWILSFTSVLRHTSNNLPVPLLWHNIKVKPHRYEHIGAISLGITFLSALFRLSLSQSFSSFNFLNFQSNWIKMMEVSKVKSVNIFLLGLCFCLVRSGLNTMLQTQVILTTIIDLIRGREDGGPGQNRKMLPLH